MTPFRPLQLSAFFATLILFISLAWFYTWANKLEVSQCIRCITLQTFQLNFSNDMACAIVCFTRHIAWWAHYWLVWTLYRWVVGKSSRKWWVQVPMTDIIRQWQWSAETEGWHQPGLALSLTDTEPEWRLGLEAWLCIAACSGGGWRLEQGSQGQCSKIKMLHKIIAENLCGPPPHYTVS